MTTVMDYLAVAAFGAYYVIGFLLALRLAWLITELPILLNDIADEVERDLRLRERRA